VPELLQVWKIPCRYGNYNAKTCSSYMDYLEGAFLIRRLPAYHASIRKRLVKSPKVYWRDTGLLHALLNLVRGRDLLDQPWVGASWEGFVIEQILARSIITALSMKPFICGPATSTRSIWCWRSPPASWRSR